MNIWALDKTTELKALLLLLGEQLEPESWLVDSKEVVDKQSVRIHKRADPSLAVYISLHGQNPGRFAVHLEYPTLVGESRFENTQIAENLEQHKALELLAMHLG